MYCIYIYQYSFFYRQSPATVFIYNECPIHPWYSEHIQGRFTWFVVRCPFFFWNGRRCHSSCHLVTHSSLLLDDQPTLRMLAMAPTPSMGRCRIYENRSMNFVDFFYGRCGEHISFPWESYVVVFFVQSCLIRGICLVFQDIDHKNIPGGHIPKVPRRWTAKMN